MSTNSLKCMEIYHWKGNETESHGTTSNTKEKTIWQTHHKHFGKICTMKELESVNKCRMWMRVISLSEICNEAGDKIEEWALKVERKNDTVLQCPNTIKPHENEWRLWWNKIKVSTGHYRGNIDQSLGSWIHCRQWTISNYIYDKEEDCVWAKEWKVISKYIEHGLNEDITYKKADSSICGYVGIPVLGRR